MFIVKLFEKILPPKERIFYTFFEESAQVCCDLASLFDDIVTQGVSEDYVIEAKRLKHKGNDIIKKTLTELNSTFITPIDREDIQILASLLHKIIRRIVKACVNLRVYRLDLDNNCLHRQADTLVQATLQLKSIVVHLQKVTKLKDATEEHHKMREIESHGDEILYKAMDELFSGQYDALTVIKLRDVYTNIESALDTCFSVSDTIVNIVLKHG